jgi:hypothetical protein
MKSKGKRDQPKPCGGQPAPSDVADDDAGFRHTIHLAQQRQRISARKMVKHLRAHHYVDAPIRERQSQCVAADGQSEHRLARARELERGV